MPLRVQIKMIVLTAIAVIVTGASSLAFMLQPPSTVRHPVAPSTTATSRETSSLRNPASIPHETANEKPSLQAIDLQLDCKQNRLEFDHSVAQIRLSGGPCTDGKRLIVSSEVRNDANGFSATVFHPTDTTFTTDYITLSLGENRIRVLHQFAQGATEERDYVIERHQ